MSGSGSERSSPLRPNLVPKEWRAVISPWTPDQELARVLMLRAAILWSYSHIEQKLTYLAIRCSHEPEYRDISEKPPFTPASRIKFLRRVLDTEGPLTAKRSLGVAILDRFDQGRDIRNQMAHADMSVLPGIARFDEIVISNGEIIHRDTPYYAGQLERIAVNAARFSKAVQRIHYRMFQDDSLDGEGEAE